MVVAGRVLDSGDVAIMMVEAEATENTIELIAGGATRPTEEVVAEGLEAAKPFIAELCRAQADLAAFARPSRSPSSRSSSTTPTRCSPPSSDAVSAELAGALTIADKQERESRARPSSRTRPSERWPSSSKAATTRSARPTGR